MKESSGCQESTRENQQQVSSLPHTTAAFEAREKVQDLEKKLKGGGREGKERVKEREMAELRRQLQSMQMSAGRGGAIPNPQVRRDKGRPRMIKRGDMIFSIEDALKDGIPVHESHVPRSGLEACSPEMFVFKHAEIVSGVFLLVKKKHFQVTQL